MTKDDPGVHAVMLIMVLHALVAKSVGDSVKR